MAVTQPIFKLEPPDFAWQQIQIISTDDNNNDNNDNDNKNDDDDNNNHNNDKNHKSFEGRATKCFQLFIQSKLTLVQIWSLDNMII